MTHVPFAERLLGLLPSVYRERDTDGDLGTFLAIPGPTLDEIAGHIDALPSAWDVDTCDPRYLPPLAEALGLTLDPATRTDTQRRAIREAIAKYRRNATMPAMRRDLERVGWQGRVNETFRHALRLNRRAVVNQRKLPGQLFSLGVYRVESDTITSGLRETIASHHPAGTRQFFLQRIGEPTAVDTAPILMPPVGVTMTGVARDYETFTVGRNRLNADWHLTLKAKAHEQCGVHIGYAVRYDVSEAGLLWTRWHARRRGFRVGRNALNRERIQDSQVWEVKSGFTGKVDAQSPTHSAQTEFRLGRRHLNEVRFGHFEPPSHVVFRQKDILGENVLPAQSALGEATTLLYADRTQLTETFRLRQSRLGSRQALTYARAPQTALTTWIGAATLARVRGEHDVVERWDARRSGFALNARASLNATFLTSSQLTQARASFELDVDTTWPYGARAESVRLNGRRLNHAALRLSVERTAPLRLGRTRLNAAGLRVSKAPLRWRYRQRDYDGLHEGRATEAVNIVRATRWPATPDNGIWVNGAPLAAYNRCVVTRWPEA